MNVENASLPEIKRGLSPITLAADIVCVGTAGLTGVVVLSQNPFTYLLIDRWRLHQWSLRSAVDYCAFCASCFIFVTHDLVKLNSESLVLARCLGHFCSERSADAGVSESDCCL